MVYKILTHILKWFGLKRPYWEVYGFETEEGCLRFFSRYHITK